MKAPARTEAQAIFEGRRKIRRSIVTAAAAGGLLLASGFLRWERWPLGLCLGLFYASAFEYLTHRFLLHNRAGYLHQRHQLHHESWGRWDEALYIRLGPPAAILALLAVHSLPLVLLDRFGAGIGAGAWIALVAYYAAYEETHWRIHLGHLPAFLEGIRRRHVAHHRGVPGRYGVLLPLFDPLLGGGKKN